MINVNLVCIYKISYDSPLVATHSLKATFLYSNITAAKNIAVYLYALVIHKERNGIELCIVVPQPFRIESASTSTTTKSLQLRPTLCNPIDGSPPGSAVPGILQARTLEWVAISFSNA